MHIVISLISGAFHPITDPKLWHDMFFLSVPIVEKMARPVFVYVFLIVGLRLAGKRELAQLNPFDLIVLLTLSNTVQNAIIGDDNSVTGGMIGAATLLFLNYAVVRTVHRSKKLQHLVEGRRDILIKDGQLRTGTLERELITPAELRAAAHREGIASLKEVERCVLEPTGTISFIKKEPTREDNRHEELVALLQQVRQELAAVRAKSAAAN